MTLKDRFRINRDTYFILKNLCLFHKLIYHLQITGGLDWLATTIMSCSDLILTYPNFRNKACPIRKASYYMMQAFVNDILNTCLRDKTIHCK